MVNNTFLTLKKGEWRIKLKKEYEESLLKTKGFDAPSNFPSFCNILKEKGISETGIASYFSEKTGTLFENVLTDIRRIDIGKKGL